MSLLTISKQAGLVFLLSKKFPREKGYQFMHHSIIVIVMRSLPLVRGAAGEEKDDEYIDFYK
jgi:hypothetical protein